MPGTQQNQAASPRCILCPAGCRLQLVSSGPDAWRVEYPLTEATGLCPRGAVLGELLTHNRRIVAAARRSDGALHELSLQSALQEILSSAGEGPLTILLDGNLPCEQLSAAVSCCEKLSRAKLCLVVEPADEQLLLGTEATGCEYLSGEQLGGCDGFVIVGDAFAANPICSRGIFDRRNSEPRTPVVVIDPGAGTASKFATHLPTSRPGTELAVLSAVAAGAGITVDLPGLPDPGEMPSAATAGAAIAGCNRLAVIIAAEYGRGASWRQIGYLAGQLAKALGGGVAPQTVGANALAAVRLGNQAGTVSLAEALGDAGGVRIAIGVDVLGMLGWCGSSDGQRRPTIHVAAAALPNCTTDAAEFVLPVAMAAELGGTFLFDGANPVRVTPLLPPPAGVLSPGELIAALAEEAGVAAPEIPSAVDPPARIEAEQPAATREWDDPFAPVLLLGRQACDSGCGALTGHGSWQRGVTETAELRFSADYAREGPNRTGTVRRCHRIPGGPPAGTRPPPEQNRRRKWDRRIRTDIPPC